MLNNDVLRLIFEECPLESCLALGDTCRAASDVLASLDKTMVMNKVQDRAPWLELSSRYYTSWTTCARVLVARSQRAHEGKHENLKIIEDLHQVVFDSFIDAVSVEPTDMCQDDSLRRNMKPLFPYSRLDNLGKPESVIEGTKVLCEIQELELTTMELRAGDYDPEDKFYPIRNRKSVSVAPSGLKVRHRDDIEVEVVAENKKLLQVQYYVGDTDTEIDEIVYKESQPKGEDGTLVIDPDMDVPRFQANYNTEIGMVNLVPGSGGALVIQNFFHDPDSSYLGYIEPTSERRIMKLFKIPRPINSHDIGFDKANQWFYVLYNGFLYLYFSGRFLRLWVDLDTTRKRALTVWNSDFPAIGPFGPFRDVRATWTITQGGPEDDLERFVTIGEEPSGCVVGDLETGKIYFARGSAKNRAPTVPFATEFNTVGFYAMDEEVWEFIEHTMDCLYGTGENYDISLLYESFLKTHHEKLRAEGEGGSPSKKAKEEPSREDAEKELSAFVNHWAREDSDDEYESEEGAEDEAEEELGERLDDLAEQMENLAV